MTDVASLIEDMVRAGVDPELIGRTAAALVEREPVVMRDEQAERRRAMDRERQFAPYAQVRESRSGPKARWGYEGPITPRLPEREWLVLRGQILRRDGHVCSYCGVTEAQWCVDHIIPLSRGGTNDPDNLVACCFPCNSSKSDKLLEEWGGRH